MIYDMDYPYGGPENWEQHERENERLLSSLDALERFYQLIAEKGMSLNDLGHFQRLRYECGIDDKQFERHLAKKEAA
jgi:hypothetical protein